MTKPCDVNQNLRVFCDLRSRDRSFLSQNGGLLCAYWHWHRKREGPARRPCPATSPFRRSAQAQARSCSSISIRRARCLTGGTSARPNFPAFAQTTVARLASDLAVLRQQGFKLAVIDTPPAITMAIQSVISVAELIVVPTRPSPQDRLPGRRRRRLLPLQSCRPPAGPPGRRPRRTADHRHSLCLLGRRRQPALPSAERNLPAPADSRG